jgi:hypothetical protein
MEGRMLKITKYVLAVFTLILLILVLARPAWSPDLTLVVTPTAQVYNAGADTLQIDGTLKNDGVLVSDAFVLLQINQPKGSAWVIRTLTTGQTPPGPFPVEVLNVTSTDSNGLPKSLFNRNQDAGFKVAIRNNAGSTYSALVMVNLYYSNGVPFKLFKIFNSTVEPGDTVIASIYPVNIPADAIAGTAKAYASIFSDFPNSTGFAYGPEAIGTFNIVTGGGGSTPPQSPPGTFNLSIPLKSIPIWLGNYSVYARTQYGFLVASGTTAFRVVLTGDLDHNGKIDMKDIATVAKAFSTKPGDTNWNPAADLNLDGKVDMKDVAIVAKAFGIITIP